MTTATVMSLPVLSSCDSLIYDDQGDCSVRYRVPFTFTMNLLDVDAFHKDVTDVTLYVFNEDGSLALTKTESGSALSTPDYAMDIELKPGKYSMLAWCNGQPYGEDVTSFIIGGDGKPSSITDLTATLPLQGAGQDAYSDKDIVPLYHGYISSIELPKEDYGVVTLPAIDLTKDTKLVNVIIENLDGTEFETSDFSFRIKADNSELAWNNEVVGNKTFNYLPWNVTALSSIRSRSDEEEFPITGIMSETSIGRLMIDQSPTIVVTRNSDNTDIIKINLIQQLMKIRGSYKKLYPAQEFLDRLDFISMTFIVDSDLNWYTAGGININGWKVVPDANVSF